MNRLVWSIPLIVIVALILLLGRGLDLDPRKVDSPLINKPAPDFQATVLLSGEPTGLSDILGEVTLLNVWASWCVACRQEHPLMNQLARTGVVRIVGLNYKDARADGIRWLEQHGNPYAWSVADFDGRIGIDYGVYGVPETFIIDAKGQIRGKRIGPVTPDYISGELIPLIQKLQQENTPSS